MKKALLKKVAELSETLKRIGNLAKVLPETGPVPTYVGVSCGGEIRYQAKQIPAISEAFGATGWKPERRNYSAAVDYIKKLENGVTIRIEYAEPARTP